MFDYSRLTIKAGRIVRRATRHIYVPGRGVVVVRTLLDLYPAFTLGEYPIAHDAVSETLNNRYSTTRRIARMRFAALAGLATEELEQAYDDPIDGFLAWQQQQDATTLGEGHHE